MAKFRFTRSKLSKQCFFAKYFTGKIKGVNPPLSPFRRPCLGAVPRWKQQLECEWNPKPQNCVAGPQSTEPAGFWKFLCTAQGCF